MDSFPFYNAGGCGPPPENVPAFTFEGLGAIGECRMKSSVPHIIHLI
jgi:hypothetical protein